jgi:ISXO2 transposase-like protein
LAGFEVTLYGRFWVIPEGTVEADETYIGGKYDARRKRARYDKEPVFGVIQRDGKARTYHLSRKPTLKGVVEKIKDNVSHHRRCDLHR